MKNELNILTRLQATSLFLSLNMFGYDLSIVIKLIPEGKLFTWEKDTSYIFRFKLLNIDINFVEMW